MLKGSDSSLGLHRPNANNCCFVMPSFCSAYSPRYCSISEDGKQSKPAATAVCVVKRIPGLTVVRAVSKGRPVCCIKQYARSRIAKAA